MSPKRKPEGDASQQNPPIDVHTTINMPPRTDAPAESAAEPEKPDFFSYMASLSEAQWREHIVYLTRENPRSSIAGTGGYLTKFTQAFDQEDIKQAYGGYDFSYIMKKNNKIIYAGKFHVEHPPRLDATRELPPAGQPQQQSGELVKEFISVLRDELARSREANLPGAGSEHVVDMMAKASDRAMELVTKRAGENNGVGNLAETIALVKSLMPPPAASPWDAFANILKSPLIEPLVTRLLSPPDPMTQITQLSGLIGAIDTLRGNSGGGGGGGKDWKSQVVEGILTKAPEIIREIRETASESAKAAADRRAASEATERTAHVMATRGGPGAPPPPPGASASPLRTVPIPPAGAPSDQLLPFVPDPHYAEQPPPAGVVDLPEGKKSDVIAEFIKTTMVRMFNESLEPDYVVDFLDEADPEICDQLVQYPAAAVTAYLANDPILAPMVNHPAWPKFLDECRAYIQRSNDAPAPAEPTPN